MDSSENQKKIVLIILLAIIPLSLDVAGIMMKAMGNSNYNIMYIVSLLLWLFVIIVSISTLYKKKKLEDIIKENKHVLLDINELYSNKENMIHIQVFYDYKNVHNSFIYWLDGTGTSKEIILNNYKQGKFKKIKLFVDPNNLNTQMLDLNDICKANNIKDINDIRISSRSINGVRYL